MIRYVDTSVNANELHRLGHCQNFATDDVWASADPIDLVQVVDAPLSQTGLAVIMWFDGRQPFGRRAVSAVEG